MEISERILMQKSSHLCKNHQDFKNYTGTLSFITLFLLAVSNANAYFLRL